MDNVFLNGSTINSPANGIRSSQQVLANKISLLFLSNQALLPSIFLNCPQITESALSVPIPQFTLMTDTPKSCTYLSAVILISLERPSRTAIPPANRYHIDKKCLSPPLCVHSPMSFKRNYTEGGILKNIKVTAWYATLLCSAPCGRDRKPAWSSQYQASHNYIVGVLPTTKKGGGRMNRRQEKQKRKEKETMHLPRPSEILIRKVDLQGLKRQLSR